MRWLIGLIAVIGLALTMRAGLVAFAGLVILGVFLLSRYLAREWVTHLSAVRACDTKPREVGDELEVIVRVENGGRWPIPWVLTEDLVPDQAIRQRRVTFNGSRIRLMLLRTGQKQAIKYKLTFRNRGYYQLGPCVAETGDVFGLYRRHRVLTDATFVLVYPRVLSLAGFDFSSARPIGEIRLANRLFEDPTRSAGVRPYQLGDPLQRVHWRATARTGQLHSKVYEPTSLAGATILLDFYADGYPSRNEPNRSELAVTLAASLANAVLLLNQQIGLASNGRDATDRIREESLTHQPDRPDGYATRGGARDQFAEKDKNERLRPVVVETRRGYDQFQKIRETLARLELTDGMSFDRLVLEMGPRMPRDATVIAVLPRVPVETSVALGQLRRQGFAVSAVLVGLADDGSDARAVAAGRLMAEGIRDVRFVNADAEVMALGDRAASPVPTEYAVAADLA